MNMTRICGVVGLVGPDADDLGKVAADKIANLVLLDANPLEDIAHIRRISAVVSDGHYMDRETLDGMVTDVEERVNSRMDP